MHKTNTGKVPRVSALGIFSPRGREAPLRQNPRPLQMAHLVPRQQVFAGVLAGTPGDTLPALD